MYICIYVFVPQCRGAFQDSGPSCCFEWEIIPKGIFRDGYLVDIQRCGCPGSMASVGGGVQSNLAQNNLWADLFFSSLAADSKVPTDDQLFMPGGDAGSDVAGRFLDRNDFRDGNSAHEDMGHLPDIPQSKYRRWNCDESDEGLGDKLGECWVKSLVILCFAWMKAKILANSAQVLTPFCGWKINTLSLRVSRPRGTQQALRRFCRLLHTNLGQKSYRTKVPRIVWIVDPKLSPNSAPIIPRIFWGRFVLCFPEKGDHWKFTKNPCHFSIPNPQANSTKKSTRVFWRAGKVKKLHKRRVLVPIDKCFAIFQLECSDIDRAGWSIARVVSSCAMLPPHSTTGYHCHPLEFWEIVLGRDTQAIAGNRCSFCGWFDGQGCRFCLCPSKSITILDFSHRYENCEIHIKCIPHTLAKLCAPCRFESETAFCRPPPLERYNCHRHFDPACLHQWRTNFCPLVRRIFKHHRRWGWKFCSINIFKNVSTELVKGSLLQNGFCTNFSTFEAKSCSPKNAPKSIPKNAPKNAQKNGMFSPNFSTEFFPEFSVCVFFLQ